MRNSKLIIALISLIISGNLYGQDYCAQAENIPIQPAGSCNGTAISLGADFDNQDDLAGQTDITVSSACTTPAGSWNVYWGTFVGTGNPVTIKL